MKVYLQQTSKVLSQLNTSEQGLSGAEAAKRLAANGKNRLAEQKKDGILKRFILQMADPMIIVLLFAAVLSGITSVYSGESMSDVFIILFVVVLNSVLGVVQESKAEKAIDALKKMTAATSKVLRNGKIVSVKSEELTVGDVVLLEAGDSVPADGRIIECSSMKVEESALTGESVPSEKTDKALTASDGHVSLGDRKNMVYMGSTVVYGRGKAVICDIGMNTEMGKIASALSQARDEATPLQRKLAGLSKILTWIVLCVCLVMFAVGILKKGAFTTDVVLETFMIAVSLAVAAIPEGLAAVVTIVLSMGVTRMSKRNAVIRKMTAVETLGCAQVVCSDKTGTLTQNKMTVVDCYGEDKQLLAQAMALCSDAELSGGKAIGEPTECALVEYAYKQGFGKAALKSKYPRCGEAPFDSQRKMMSTVHNGVNGVTQFTKGAPDEILKRCTCILEHGTVRAITDADRAKIMQANKGFAGRALRVLAAAMRTHHAPLRSYEADNLEHDMTFIGLTGMIDPVRPEVKAAVAKCKQAGVDVVMITGDYIDTAVAIAKELGIIKDASEAIMGSQLDKMSDAELKKNIARYHVYARVQPEHKVRIVKAWKRLGKIVAMTGDGVNDAPSIKTADIGIGMGVTGTDVTKNVADMILADDNFATIVSAMEEGRRIYANIRKAIQFLLSSNLSEVVSIFVATMLNFSLMKPAHILWINLITDSLPALALGMEPGEEDSMRKKPRNPKDGIFAGGVGADLAYQGLLISVLTLAAYFIGHFMEAGRWEITDSADGMTMAFLTMSMAEIFHTFNMRSQRGSVFTIKKQNFFLWGAAGLALLLTTGVIYVPFLKTAFGFTSISLMEYVTALGLAFAVIPVVEVVKLIQRKTGRH